MAERLSKGELEYVSCAILREADEYADSSENPNEWLCHVLYGCAENGDEFSGTFLARLVLERLSGKGGSDGQA